MGIQFYKTSKMGLGVLVLMLSLVLTACNKKEEAVIGLASKDVSVATNMEELSREFKGLVEDAHKDAQVELEVEDLMQTRIQLDTLLKPFAAKVRKEDLYLDSQRGGRSELTIQVQNPKVEELILGLRSLGRLESVRITTRSLTDEIAIADTNLNRAQDTSTFVSDSLRQAQVQWSQDEKARVLKELEFGEIQLSISQKMIRPSVLEENALDALEASWVVFQYILVVCLFVSPFALGIWGIYWFLRFIRSRKTLS
jgi:hypothetical protein